MSHPEESGRGFAHARFVYRLLLRLYPRSFRREYEPLMIEALRDRWRTERARGGRFALRVWWLVLRDLARSVPEERRSARRTKESGSGNRPTKEPRRSLPDAVRDIGGDWAYSFRGMAKRPGFTALAVTILALGIGANSAIFTVIDDVIISPLPFEGDDRLVFVVRHNERLGARIDGTRGIFVDLTERARSYDALEAYEAEQGSLTGIERPLVVSRLNVTPTFLSSFGIDVLVGRDFRPEDAAPGAGAVAVLGETLWEQAFDSDPTVIGRSVALDNTRHTIVGVRRGGFELPSTAIGPQIWTLLPSSPVGQDDRSAMSIVGRLRPGVSPSDAQAELDRLRAGTVGRSEWMPVVVRPQSFLGSTFRSGLWLLTASVGFVLLIACANVAHMILARGLARRQETAIRTALGASRARVVRLMMTESLALCLVGGAFAILLAHWVLRLILTLRPPTLSSLALVDLDVRTFLFTLSLSALASVLFGLLPAWSLSDLRATHVLPAGAGSSRTGVEKRSLRRTLVGAQSALAVVLLVGAGLMARSFSRLQSVDPGFDVSGLGTVRVVLPVSRYPDATQQELFFDQLLEVVRAMPGVESAVATTGIPPALSADLSGPTVEGVHAVPPEGWSNVTSVVSVEPGYFETVRTPILRGRPFVAEDVHSGEDVAIINEAFVRRFLPREEPIGRRFRLDDDAPWKTVIGVARDVKAFGLADDPDRLQVYTPHRSHDNFGQLAIRATDDFRALVHALEQQLRALDPDLPVRQAVAVEDMFSDSIARERFITALHALFAILATLLTAAGVYGVVSVSVRQRVPELGIRIALGAGAREVLRVVLSEGIGPVAVGVLIGLAGSIWSTGLIESQLFNQDRFDPWTWVAVPLVIGMTSLVACYGPARRALAIDPLDALRSE